MRKKIRHTINQILKEQNYQKFSKKQIKSSSIVYFKKIYMIFKSNKYKYKDINLEKIRSLMELIDNDGFNAKKIYFLEAESSENITKKESTSKIYRFKEETVRKDSSYLNEYSSGKKEKQKNLKETKDNKNIIFMVQEDKCTSKLFNENPLLDFDDEHELIFDC